MILEKNKIIILILLISLVIRLIFIDYFRTIWWDAAVYVGMGKYLFSYGKYGIWEIVRPIMWPIILGFFWKLNLSISFFGKLLELIFSLAIIFLTYLIANKLFNKKVAIISAIVVSFNAIFLFWGYRLYTNIPATFFLLLSYYFLLVKRRFYFLAGIFSGLAMLTRFPVAVFAIPPTAYLLYMLIREKTTNRFLDFFYYILPIFILLSLFSIFNYYMYGNYFHTIKNGLLSTRTWSTFGKIYFLLPTNIWVYLISFLLFLNTFLLSLIYGFYLLLKKFNIKTFFYLILPIILYLIFLHITTLREERFLIPIIPFVAIIGAYGLVSFFKKAKAYPLIILLLVYIIINLVLFISIPAPNKQSDFYTGNSLPKDVVEQCSKFEEIASSNPVALLKWDKIQPYYGDWTNDLFKERYIDLGCYIYSSCDFSGELDKEFLYENYDEIYNKKEGNCEYLVFRIKSKY